MSATLFPVPATRPKRGRIDTTERRIRVREIRSELVDVIRDAADTMAPIRGYMDALTHMRGLFELENDPQENLCAAYLSAQYRVIAAERVYRGTVNSAAVGTRDIARSALVLNACAVIVAHNHPSGIASPSADDLVFTDKLKRSLKLFNIELLDHLIIPAGGGVPYSLAERGQI
jgi:DNA repair protein RadC